MRTQIRLRHPETHRHRIYDVDPSLDAVMLQALNDVAWRRGFEVVSTCSGDDLEHDQEMLVLRDPGIDPEAATYEDLRPVTGPHLVLAWLRDDPLTRARRERTWWDLQTMRSCLLTVEGTEAWIAKIRPSSVTLSRRSLVHGMAPHPGAPWWDQVIAEMGRAL